MKELCLFECSARRCTMGRRADRINNSFHMTRHIGSTNYKVKIVLAENGKETMAEKILRMMQNEMLEPEADRGILDLSQASLQSGRSA
ncbi:MAG: transposon-encoded TnpW family protein [Clostridiales bacterium]|nr:transposon-encoded TnpW family protein [Clostridiales bacterium]